MFNMTDNDKIHRIFAFGPFRLDLSDRLLSRGGKVVPLAPKLFETLALLVENAGHTVEKDEMLERLWQDTFVEESSLSQNIFQLRKVLENGASGQNYIETIPKRGYRFAADVYSEVENSNGGSRPSDSWQAAPLKVRSLAVMPFTPLSGSDEEYLGLGMADAAIVKLGGINDLRVMTTRTMLKYSGRRDTMRSMAREHGVDAVLEGTVQRSGERVRVTVQLISTGDGTAMWSGKFDERFTDIFAVQDSISEQLAVALALELTSGEMRRLKSHGTKNTEAYQSYLIGIYFSNKRTKEALSTSIDYFRESIRLDPDHALAYAGIADSFFWLAYGEPDAEFRHESFERSRANALKAIELEPSAEAYAALATVKIKHDRDPAGAEASFRQAIALDPNCAIALSRYTYFLAAVGRLDEALQHIRRAQQIDPLSPDANASLAMILYFLGRFDDSIRYCEIALALEPGSEEAILLRGRCHEQQGRFLEAAAAYEMAKKMNPNSTESDELLGHLYAITGRKSQAGEVLSRLMSSAMVNPTRPFNTAAIYAAFGEIGLALEWLERPFINWTERMRMLRYDPRLDGLRADPRFAEIVESSASGSPLAGTTLFPHIDRVYPLDKRSNTPASALTARTTGH
jgi:DNA-binding winged helix-turn-helix (wHTH) protein/tetratricopeptide (TPR) repeat protein